MYWYKNMPESHAYEDYQKSRSGTGYIRRAFVRYFLLMLVLGVVFIIFSGISYVDVPNQCFIKIKYDVIKGDKGSIVEGLKVIKEEDFVLYKNICRHIDTIYEKRCIRGEDDKPDVRFLSSGGCYIKGSGAILINPVKGGTRGAVDIRVEAISKYAQMAIDYIIFGDESGRDTTGISK